MLIEQAMVWTGTGAVIENGWVRMEDGRLVELGDGTPPSDSRVIDAAGRWLLPGLIDAHSHLGMYESLNGFEGADGNEKTDPITPHLRAIDAINPGDVTFSEALEAGVTCVAAGPGSANVIGGTFAALRTHGDCIDKMVIRDPVAMKCAFGKNPKASYDSQKKSPSTRMAIAALLREAILKAQRYQLKIDAAGDDPGKLPDLDMKHEALLPVLKGEIPLKAHAHRADDMFTALRIAREFNLRITLDHATEGALIAEDLAAAGVPCIVGPSFGHRSKYELEQKSFKTAAKLVAAGILVAITTDSPVTPLDSLPLMAALAVKAGLDRDEALKAVTVNPARILGIDDRLGSVQAGLEADLVIFDGDPLCVQASPWKVIVRGDVVVSKP